MLNECHAPRYTQTHCPPHPLLPVGHPQHPALTCATRLPCLALDPSALLFPSDTRLISSLRLSFISTHVNQPLSGTPQPNITHHRGDSERQRGEMAVVGKASTPGPAAAAHWEWRAGWKAAHGTLRPGRLAGAACAVLLCPALPSAVRALPGSRGLRRIPSARCPVLQGGSDQQGTALPTHNTTCLSRHQHVHSCPCASPCWCRGGRVQRDHATLGPLTGWPGARRTADTSGNAAHPLGPQTCPLRGTPGHVAQTRAMQPTANRQGPLGCQARQLMKALPVAAAAPLLHHPGCRPLPAFDRPACCSATIAAGQIVLGRKPAAARRDPCRPLAGPCTGVGRTIGFRRYTT